MQRPPAEVITTHLVWMIFWILVVGFILLVGRRKESLRGFRERMMAQWRPSLAMTVVYLVSSGLGGGSFLNPFAITVFCQALVGLAVAKSINGFEPLPVTHAIGQREKAWRSVGLMLLVALLLVPVVVIVGSLGLNIAQQIFGETNQTSEAMGMLPANKWLTFFALFSGAGIAEETTHRLVFLSLFLRITRRRWLAVLLSALVFGAYHLSPLDSMYSVFWQFPLSQFLASTLVGVVLGIVYIKRGYETVVLGHTLSDWIPMMIFMD